MGDLQPSHLMATGWEQRGLAGGAAAGAGGKGDHGAGHGECHPVCEPEPIHAVEAVRASWMLGDQRTDGVTGHVCLSIRTYTPTLTQHTVTHMT